MRRSMAVLAALCVLGAAAGCEQRSNVVQEIQRQQKAELEASIAFMDEARARPGVQTTPTGLAYEITAPGGDPSLPSPTAESRVLVFYEGALPNGQVFDSTTEAGQPRDFVLNQVIPGWTEGFQRLKPGDEAILYIPPELGYGAMGSPPRIPPNSALQFRVKLLAIQFPDGTQVLAPGLATSGGQ